ncbi:methyltransferase [Aurantibacillus circumpalustris]|uniref:methyltransferase n=1 Tax=Aurantibacillus circumpalustris TaxID=3036359 RepID=UPI00295C14F1|nr:methyltransferase [Aurantibacillus circumpalustris]
MRRLSYIFYNTFYKYILKLYLKSDSNVKFDKFKLKVFKEVFHPKLFFSTKYLYKFLLEKKFTNLNFLEIGSGTGVLSMLAFQKGASVTAIDIDPKAVENTQLNFSMNFKSSENLHIYQSDLFMNIPSQLFDFVVINPPYYFKKVETNAHYAWYCGENGEYFERLSSQLKTYVNDQTETYMILEENCDIQRIKKIASLHGLNLKVLDEKMIKWEKNYIFQLSYSNKL